MAAMKCRHLILLLSLVVPTRWHHVTAQTGPLKSMCTSLAKDQHTSIVNLTCSDAGLTWFHVIQMVYTPNSTDNCSLVRNGTQKIQSSSDHQNFAPLCVGKQTNRNINRCLEQVTRYNDVGLQGTQFVSVVYECVNESLNFNMCEDVSLQLTGDVYLASPDMFYQPVNNSLCRCRVKAAGLQLQALYISIDDGNQLNMTCQQCSLGIKKYYTTIRNINVTTDTSKNTTYSLDMDFYDFNANLRRNRVWLKLSGTDNVVIQCNGGVIPYASVATSEPSTTTNSPQTSQEHVTASRSVILAETSPEATKESPATSPAIRPTTSADTTSVSEPAVTTNSPVTSQEHVTASTKTNFTSTEKSSATSAETQPTTSAGRDTGLFIGGLFSGAVCVLAIVLAVFLIRRHPKNGSNGPTIGPPQLVLSTNRDVITDPRVSDVYELSPTQAGGSDAADDVTEDAGVPHVYSGLTPPEERGIDSNNDNYTSLPQSYANVTPRQQNL